MFYPTYQYGYGCNNSKSIADLILQARKYLWLTLCLVIMGCGGGGGGGNDAVSQTPDNTTPDNYPDVEQDQNDSESGYYPLEVHLGFEHEVSASRINYPIFIPADSDNWLLLSEEFRQLGSLVDEWNKASKKVILLPETRNTPLLGADVSVFKRNIRIIQTNWVEIGEMCGYGSSGLPNNGCSYNKNLPDCTIYVPTQEIYKNGNIDSYHALLGHEMWHCLVGSFH